MCATGSAVGVSHCPSKRSAGTTVKVAQPASTISAARPRTQRSADAIADGILKGLLVHDVMGLTSHFGLSVGKADSFDGLDRRGDCDCPCRRVGLAERNDEGDPDIAVSLARRSFNWM